MEKFFKYAWVLVGIVVLTFVYSNQADKNNKKVLDSIAEYEYCLSGSNKIFINDEYKEMTDADMIAICIYKNDTLRQTDYYENALPSIKAEVCTNKKPYNRDVLKKESHATYERVYNTGLRIPAIHDTDAFWREYNADERHAYWAEKYRSTGQTFICGI